MWLDLAKFWHFGKIMQVFSNILKVYLVLGKILNLLHDIFRPLGNFVLLQMAKLWKII